MMSLTNPSGVFSVAERPPALDDFSKSSHDGPFYKGTSEISLFRDSITNNLVEALRCTQASRARADDDDICITSNMSRGLFLRSSISYFSYAVDPISNEQVPLRLVEL